MHTKKNTVELKTILIKNNKLMAYLNLTYYSQLVLTFNEHKCLS